MLQEGHEQAVFWCGVEPLRPGYRADTIPLRQLKLFNDLRVRDFQPSQLLYFLRKLRAELLRIHSDLLTLRHRDCLVASMVSIVEKLISYSVEHLIALARQN